MATRGDERHVARGTVIFRQGELGDEMFVVAAGRVRLTIAVDGAAREVAVFGPGEFFGELCVLSEDARTATAEAIEDTTLLVISRDAFAMLVQDDLAIVFRMLRTQGRRLSLGNEALRALGLTLRRIRVIAHALQRLGGGTALPWTAAVPELAAELETSADFVSATVAEITAGGAGVLRDGAWCIDSPQEVAKLLEALCRYATEEPA